MKNTTSFMFFVLLFCLPALAKAQATPEDEYTSTFTYGINFNTNGGTIGGGNIKFTQITKPRLYRSLGLEIVAIKHPQESKFLAQNGRVVYAKRNYFYSVRPTYGYDYLLFRKAPEESVQVTANFAVGPSIGVEMPYYVILSGNAQTPATIRAYDPTKISASEIEGTAGIFKGIGESKIIPGLFVKAGISLEFGEFRNNLTGIEVGFTSELFSRAPNILEPLANGGTTNLRNKQYMFGAYLTLFLGSRK
jgi:hypothetical protein